MATYDRLSVSAGGGILNDLKKSERQDEATICIGLGGTGKDALKKLKYEVHKRLKPDNPDSDVPTYKNIKFLVIDSDSAGLNKKGDLASIDPQTEFLDISNANIRRFLQSPELITNRTELDWLNYKNIKIEEAGNGAGGIRQVGRFLLIDKALQLKTKLSSMIREARLGVTGDVNVHIFSGISGGTGSGTFIDTCYITRHVLETEGCDAAQISGYFFLPDVNLSIPAVSQDPLISKYVKCNGYAALKELDYLMDMENGHGKFSQSYGSFAIESTQPPVNLCYLISTTTSDGMAMPNGYNYGLSVAVDYVISFLSRVTLPENVDVTASSMTLKGHITNLCAAKAGIQKLYGASFEYNIVGAANAEMPLSDISTYLASKLFGRFDTVFDRTPTEKDLTGFVAGTQMTFEQLLQALTKGVTYKVPYPPNLLKSGDIIPGDKRAITCADTWTANALGTLEENRKKMTEPLKNYDVPENSTSLISRIFSYLYLNCVKDTEKGPFFAQKLLGGQNNKNMLHIIDGYIANNEERLQAELRQEPLRRQELDTAEQSLAKAHFLNKGNRTEGYLNALSNWYVHLAVIDRHNCMKNLLRELRDQVVKLNNEFFLVLTIVLDTIRNTFAENERRLAQGNAPASGYTWQIMSIKDISEQLDRSVEEMDAGQEFGKLVDRLFKNWKEWTAQDEGKVARLVSDYINAEFMTITNREITDYLKMKYGTDNGTLLTQRIKEDIIQGRLTPNSNPLFWRNSLFDLSQVARNCTVSVPFNATEIVAAAEETAATGDTVRKTGLTDRIFMMRFYSGVPLYAYQALAELEKAYESDLSTCGRHLYEVGEVDWRKYLPSPFPGNFKMSGHSIPRIAERNQKLTADLDEAIAKGIVFHDKVDWRVKKSRTADTDTLIQQAGGYEENGKTDLLKLIDVTDALESARDKMYSDDNVDLITLSTKGARNDAGKTVLYDNYCRYPEVEKVVEGELEKIRTLDQKIEELKKLQEIIGSAGNDQDNFFKAVFTGVIKMERTKMTYTYEQFGMEEILDLQNSSMAYGTKAPLYQAFLTYKELDTDMKGMINEKTVEAIDSMTDEIYEVSKVIQGKYSSDFLKMTLSKVATDPSRKEIQTFYQDFMKALQEYRVTYA